MFCSYAVQKNKCISGICDWQNKVARLCRWKTHFINSTSKKSVKLYFLISGPNNIRIQTVKVTSKLVIEFLRVLISIAILGYFFLEE